MCESFSTRFRLPRRLLTARTKEDSRKRRLEGNSMASGTAVEEVTRVFCPGKVLVVRFDQWPPVVGSYCKTNVSDRARRLLRYPREEVRTYAEVHLERIVNQPLERSERTNHANPDRQTVPQPAETNVSINPADSLASTLTGLAIGIQLRHHHVSRVRDHRAANTSNVASEERNSSLLERVVGLLGLAELRINLRNSALERRELDHRVRDLARP
jgi:hypothetical protein